MSESTQQKLSRVRPPRVQITYDVETGDAIQKKELPFVVGILADLSMKTPQENFALKDRAFIEIDRDNFAAVMAQLKPTVPVKVTDVQADDPKAEDAKLSYSLEFSKLDDFKPNKLVEKLTAVAGGRSAVSALWKERVDLRDMLTKLDGNDKLLKLLKDVAEKNGGLSGLLTDAKTHKTALESELKALGSDTDDSGV